MRGPNLIMSAVVHEWRIDLWKVFIESWSLQWNQLQHYLLVIFFLNNLGDQVSCTGQHWASGGIKLLPLVLAYRCTYWLICYRCLSCRSLYSAIKVDLLRISYQEDYNAYPFTPWVNCVTRAQDVVLNVEIHDFLFFSF